MKISLRCCSKVLSVIWVAGEVVGGCSGSALSPLRLGNLGIFIGYGSRILVIPYDLGDLPMGFFRMINQVQHQVTDIGLDDDGAIFENCRLKARYLIVNILDFVVTKLDDLSAEKAVLLNVYDSMVGNYIDTEIPAHPFVGQVEHPHGNTREKYIPRYGLCGHQCQGYGANQQDNGPDN